MDSNIFLNIVQQLNEQTTCLKVFDSLLKNKDTSKKKWWTELWERAAFCLLSPSMQSVVGVELKVFLPELLSILAHHKYLGTPLSETDIDPQSISNEDQTITSANGKRHRKASGTAVEKKKLKYERLPQSSNGKNKRVREDSASDVTDSSLPDSHSNVAYLRLHRALCVALSQLYPIAPSVIKQFLLEYFESHPPPYISHATKLDESEGDSAAIKTIPATSTVQILKSTYKLALDVRELTDLWQCWNQKDLLSFTDGDQIPKIRWYACKCLALITTMTESEEQLCMEKHVDTTVAQKMEVEFALEMDTKVHTVPIDVEQQEETGEEVVPLPLKYTRVVGKNLIAVPDEAMKLKLDPSQLLHLVPSTERNLHEIWCHVSACKPVLVEGIVGCGKTSLIEHLAAVSGYTEAPLLTKIQLGAQTDSKSLLGTYRCTATPGEFIWSPGAVTRAVTQGHWLLLEDIDSAQQDTVAVISSLLSDRKLSVTGTGSVVAHRNFRLFGTRRLGVDGRKIGGVSGASTQLESHWARVKIDVLSQEEMKEVLSSRFPRLQTISERLIQMYLDITPFSCGGNEGNINARIRASNSITATSVSGRLVCFRDLMKYAERINKGIESNSENKDISHRAFEEAMDCFCAAIPDSLTRERFAIRIASDLNLSVEEARRLMKEKPSVQTSNKVIRIGNRVTVKKLPAPISMFSGESKAPFSYTHKSCKLLERISVAIENKESVLIVGETGTGKTTAVQYLAHQINQKLRVINMNQQSDSTDLLGGFKPVQMKTIIFPLREEFTELFSVTFPAEKSKFLNHVTREYGRCDWKKLIKLLLGTEEMAQKLIASQLEKVEKTINETTKSEQEGKPVKKRKTESKNEGKSELKKLQKDKTLKETLKKKWHGLRIKLEQALGHVEKSQSALAFSYIEGALTKAIVNGDWVLLDEINLANSETLECLSSILESQKGSLTLLERGDDKPIKRHPNFKLFACMNPATDVGKKELPAGLRNRFAEFYMDELKPNSVDDKEDFNMLISDYLTNEGITPHPKLVRSIRHLYSKICKAATNGSLSDTTEAAPHYSLRTLCRALYVASKNQACDMRRSLYEAFSMSFLTQLNKVSEEAVIKLILQYLHPTNSNASGKPKHLSILPHPTHPDEVYDDKNRNEALAQGHYFKKYVHMSGYWIPKGINKPLLDDKYILTESVKNNMKNVARVVSLGKGCPVLLQGDTSVGKTSLITYLAKACGVPCVRINNHEHTDIQEYLGCYSPDENGKLVFREGALVTAMRHGHWIILDELNLAPTDVLEALNRLLDDNRELYLPETQETVRAHPNFNLFATQNPPGLYGGRKVLSRAFRNRFVELHFDNIPGDELVEIIHLRCDISKSHSAKLVAVLQGLQVRRGRDNLFQGRQSLVTLRDLFRWAERYRLADKPAGTSNFYDWEQHLADEGYLLLAGRVRLEEEEDVIKQVIEQKMKCKIDSKKLFTLSDETSPVTRPILEKLQEVKGFEHLVFTKDMRRLYVLLSKALFFKEPALLVGETGCGKTTVCQMIAVQLAQELHGVNCHMHTEGADFLGGLRPIRNRQDRDDDKLFEWVDGPLIKAMADGGMFLADEISLADDSVLERLNSVLEPERTLVLSEKGSNSDGKDLETEVIHAHDKFRLVGTMNPGGDYGKKELSPAMRNRFTEIWCPKIEIGRESSDILTIINHNISKDLEHGGNLSIGEAMLNFLKWFTVTEMGQKCTVSIRDIMSWIEFINKSTSHEGGRLDADVCFVHGAYMTLLDGLGSGLTGTGLSGWQELKRASKMFLLKQAKKISGSDIDRSMIEEDLLTKSVIVSTKEKFGLSPFFIKKGNEGVTPDKMFTFSAHRTCVNLMRVLRGLQLNKPLLLEGSPGVGKTSLVVSLAKAVNQSIVRINLSEQTDVSDLFGADLPVEGACGGQFAWRDGPLLRALKEGSWVVFDELNLASQSVLEGLNACFDHRGEIFVPELGQTFKVSHKTTKIFACQNPQYQGGARKGLPRSFLNRFTQVFVEPLSSGDLEFILLNVFGEKISQDTIRKMVLFNEKLVMAEQKGEFGLVGGPWELNLRDLFRWCELCQHQSDTPNHRQYVELLYSARMRTQEDKRKVHNTFIEIFSSDEAHLDQPLLTVTSSKVMLGNVELERVCSGEELLKDSKSLAVLQHQLPLLQQMLTCCRLQWMTLLVGTGGTGKTTLVHQLSALTGHKLRTVTLSPQMDVGELLGGFEQVDYGRHLGSLFDRVSNLVNQYVKMALLNDSKESDSVKVQAQTLNTDFVEVLRMKRQEGGKARSGSEETELFLKYCECLLTTLQKTELLSEKLKNKSLTTISKELESNIGDLKSRVQTAGSLASGGIFEWVDSPLVTAIREGHWVLVEGASLCAASVLDRLNPLLEPNGELLLTERGVIEGKVPSVKTHPNFRLFLTIDPTYGEVSRAMRNRGVELFVFGLPNVSKHQNVAPTSVETKDAKESDVDSGHSTEDSSSVTSEDEQMEVEESTKESSCSFVKDVSWDLTALLVSSGLTDPRLQNSLVLIHRRIGQQLPSYSQPSLSTLRQVAQATLQLIQSGHTEKEALALAIHRGYIKTQNSPDLKVHLQSVVDEIFEEELTVDGFPMSKLVLQTHHLLQHSSQVLQICQMTRYLKCALESVETKDHMAFKNVPLPLVEEFPNFKDVSSELLTLISSSLPINSWHLLTYGSQYLLKEVEGGKEVVGMLKELVKVFEKCPNNFKICSEKSTCDHRFAVSVSKDISEGDLVSADNKVCISIWRALIKANQQIRKVDGIFKGRPLIEISRALHEKKLDKKNSLHRSVPFIYPLLVSLDKFVKFITESDSSISVNDEDWEALCEVLRCRDRLFDICSEVIEGREAFKSFLPKFIVHWTSLKELLVDNLPQSWFENNEAANGLSQILQKMTKSFALNHGPVHDLAIKHGSNLEHPHPFVEENKAKVYQELLKLRILYTPNIKNSHSNAVLASTECLEIRKKFVGLFLSAVSTKSSPNLDESFKALRSNAENLISSTRLNELEEKVRLMKVQTWPLIGYIINHLITNMFLTESTSAVNVKNKLKELVNFSSDMPLELLDFLNGQKDWATTNLWALESESSATRNPQEWITYPKFLETSEEDEDDMPEEVQLDVKIYSPLQSLLGLYLSYGNSQESLQQLKVGLHSEKSQQLDDIRGTIWAHWDTLSNPETSPKAFYIRSVRQFSSHLITTLMKAFPSISSEMSSLEDSLNEISAALVKQCGNEACSLFDELAKNISSIECSTSNADIEAIAIVGSLSGCLQAWIAGHLQLMDPADRKKLLLQYAEKDVYRINQEILQHSWINILRGGKPTSSEGSVTKNVEHPHLKIRRNQLETASSAVSTLSQEVAYRDESDAYSILVEDISQFVKSAMNPEFIVEEIFKLKSPSVSLKDCEQVERKLVTFDNFMHRIKRNYPLFRDVTATFLHGITLATRSIRVLCSEVRHSLMNRKCGTDVNEKLCDLSSFPTRRNPGAPLDHLPKLRESVDSLKPLFEMNDDNNRGARRCQSIALRTSLMELNNACVVTGFLNEDMVKFLNDIVCMALHWWKEQEEMRKMKEEEEASLFKYKSREHAKNETEEESSEREYAEMFPNYEGDFDDLKATELECYTEPEAKIVPVIHVDEWFDQQQMWQIAETHTNLLSRYTVTGHQSVDSANSGQLLPASLERVKILQKVLNAVGPIGDNKLDQATIGAHLLFNHAARKSLQESSIGEIVSRPKNIFADPAPLEAIKLKTVLRPMRDRLDELLSEWEGNAILLLIKKVLDRVLDYSVTAPLAKLIVGLENIHTKAQLWQSNASKKVSLFDHMENIRKVIVDWRIMELKSWKDCLAYVTHNEAVVSKMKWWPHLHECLTAESWDSEKVLVLCKTLRELMESSSLGDFESKLLLLLTFYRYKIASKAEGNDVINLICNIFKYYSQFVPHVKSKLTAEKKEIETKLKDKEEIARYSKDNFRDVSQVKDKVTKCCDSLHTQLRRWKKILNSQDREIWYKDTSEELMEPQAGSWDEKTIAQTTAVSPSYPKLVQDVQNIQNLGSDSLLCSIKRYTENSNKFVVKTIDNLMYNECVEELESSSVSIIETYHDLTKKALLAANETDKEERMSKLKSIVANKRNVMASFFKVLAEYGIKYSTGNIKWSDVDYTKCFLLPVVDSKVHTVCAINASQFCKLTEGADKYFYRCLNRYKTMEEGLMSPHADLTYDLIKRMRGYSRHMLLISMELRNQTYLLAQNVHTLHQVTESLGNSNDKPVSSVCSLQDHLVKVNAFSLSLTLMVSEVQTVIATRTSTSLVPAESSRLNEKNIDKVKEILVNVENVAKTVAQTSSKALKDYESVCTVNCNQISFMTDMKKKMEEASSNLLKAVEVIDPKLEGNMCLTNQSLAWLEQWNTFSASLDKWLSDCQNDDMGLGISNDTAITLNNCVSAVLYSVQTLYKKYVTNIEEGESKSPIVSQTMAEDMLADIKALKLNYILSLLKELVKEVSSGNNVELHFALLQVSSLLKQLAALSETILLHSMANNRAITKLLSIMLAVFNQMCLNGFCKPKDMQEDGEGEGEGKMSFEDGDDDAAGLADGNSGEKDISDELESEDQLESAKKEGEKDKPGDKDLKEDDGVEMSEDFEAKLQDVEKDEVDEDGEEEGEDKADDQKGETEKGAETLDKKLWDEEKDDDEEKEGEEDLEEDDDAHAGEQERENQLVAKEKSGKEDQQNKKDDKKKDAQEQGEDPKEMEEDRRKPNEPEEADDYDPEFEDPYADDDNENREKEKDKNEMEIPEKMDEAEEEKPEENPEENEEEEFKDIEQKGLFPEGNELDSQDNDEEKKDDDDAPEEKNDEPNEEEPNLDEMEGTEMDIDAPQVEDKDDENDPNEHKQNAGKDDSPEETKEQEEKTDESVDSSKDKDTKNDAEAADNTDKEASKDKTKQAPKADDGGKQQDDLPEEDVGQSGEQTDDVLGVGESEASPNEDDMHSSESKMTRQTRDSQNKNQDTKQKNKPTDLDEERKTGDPNKEMKKGAMTHKNQPEREDNEEEKEQKTEDKDADKWQSMKHAEDHVEGQMVDGGTKEQAMEAPAPVQEDGAEEPDEEGVCQEVMEVEEKEEPDAPAPEKKADQLADASSRDQNVPPTAEGDDLEERMEVIVETEGEVVLEHTVERPPDAYYHTMEEDEDITAKLPNEDEDPNLLQQKLLESALSLNRADEPASIEWARQQSEMGPHAAQLCDQLRLILEPTQASRLKGDYKTGKRLNMRKVIGYIASHFLKDKIWLRRTQPNKRDYHMLLAIDDSFSMKNLQAEELAKKSISLVSQALTKLEVGKVGVVSFGSETKVLHALDENFSDASGAKVFANLTFEQKESKFMSLLKDSIQLFKSARGGTVAHSDTAQILLIISDGQTHACSDAIKSAVRAARNERIFVVFFVLDADEKHSFYDSLVYTQESGLQLLAEQFPFPYYLVVRDVTKLPQVLSEALRKWFELVNADNKQ